MRPIRCSASAVDTLVSNVDHVTLFCSFYFSFGTRCTMLRSIACLLLGAVAKCGRLMHIENCLHISDVWNVRVHAELFEFHGVCKWRRWTSTRSYFYSNSVRWVSFALIPSVSWWSAGRFYKFYCKQTTFYLVESRSIIRQTNANGTLQTLGGTTFSLRCTHVYKKWMAYYVCRYPVPSVHRYPHDETKCSY